LFHVLDLSEQETASSLNTFVLSCTSNPGPFASPFGFRHLGSENIFLLMTFRNFQTHLEDVWLLIQKRRGRLFDICRPLVRIGIVLTQRLCRRRLPHRGRGPSSHVQLWRQMACLVVSVAFIAQNSTISLIQNQPNTPHHHTTTHPPKHPHHTPTQSMGKSLSAARP